MARTDTLNNFLTDIADSIRTKKGTTEPIQASNFDTEIANIESGESAGGSTGIEDKILDRTITEYSNNNITYIGRSAFDSCQVLTNVSFPNVTELASYVFSNCQRLENTNFPNVTIIGTESFKNCRKLKNIYLPKIQELGTYVFSDCEILESFNSYDLEKVPSYCFVRCYKLKTVDLEKATSISTFAFRYCNVLDTLIIRSETVCTIANTSVFSSSPIASGTGIIYVPDNLVETYKAATNWSNFAGQIKGLSELV